MSDTRRFIIATLARGQGLMGAHYLKGARGGIPGEGPAVGRTVKLTEISKWETLSVHAGSNTLQNCFGRWQTTNRFLFQVGSSELSRLKDYVAENSGNSMDSWPYFPDPPFYGAKLYPRRLGKAGSAIAAGEDCRGKRHFDCIGLIYWVLHEIAPTVKWEGHSISNYEQGFKQVDSLGRLQADELKYRDIVTRTDSSPKHIGFISLGDKVVHASMESIGTKIETYNREEWTGVSRVKDPYLW
ncbi:MAG TPA: hypothetical protein VER03_08025 [Bryobacteraceae bacterium]|nr:hypothetical protein [Bryobacteraceae bacterium]